MTVLFPSDYFTKKKPDETFSEQVHAFQALGFAVAMTPLEDLSLGKARFYRPLSESGPVLYRGWMLSGGDYGLLTQAISASRRKTFHDARAIPFDASHPQLVSTHLGIYARNGLLYRPRGSRAALGRVGLARLLRQRFCEIAQNFGGKSYRIARTNSNRYG